MRIYAAIVVLFTILGCTSKKKIDCNNREIKILKSSKLSAFSDSLLEEYIKQYPNKPAYAMFFDKKSEQKADFVLTIAPFFERLSKMDESGAINYFLLKDSIPVFIYSGIEDFVTGSREFDKSKERPKDVPEKGEFKYFDPIRRKIDFTKSWSYIHYDTVSYVVKENSHPFIINLVIKPTVQFTIPDSNGR